MTIQLNKHSDAEGNVSMDDILNNASWLYLQYASVKKSIG